jgi:putative heme-binding domain-containing protein
MIDLLGALADDESIGLLLDLATGGGSTSAVRFGALSALGGFPDEKIAQELLAAYPRQPAPWRSRARELLLCRPAWARAYLSAIDCGKLAAGELTLEEIGRFATLRAPDLAVLVRKHWGVTRGTTREERLAEVRRLNNDLRAGDGDPIRGRALFRERCATCHRLDGEGETMGPDLTHANRRDREFLLVSLVDPSGVVRKEYQAYNVVTKGGRVLSGLIVEEAPEALVLRDGKGLRSRVARADIEEIKEMDVSLMPESLYKEFSPGQLRDLFSFLQREPSGSHKEQPW